MTTNDQDNVTQSELAEVLRSLNSRFDQINKRLDALEKRFDHVDGELVAIKGKIN